LIVLFKGGESFPESFDTRVVRFARRGMGFWNGKPRQERGGAMFGSTVVAQEVSRHGVQPGKRIVLRNFVELSPGNFKS
jgi:hypothetical protein